jgi:hypothetical protein
MNPYQSYIIFILNYPFELVLFKYYCLEYRLAPQEIVLIFSLSESLLRVISSYLKIHSYTVVVN